MATERLANLGYLAIKKQTNDVTPITPDFFIPAYETTLSTDANFQDQDPIYGNKYKKFNTIRGTRSHKGDVTVLGEPNSAARLFDNLLTKGTTTGTGPYTTEFTLGPDSAVYTYDISTGNIVVRYVGVKASSFAPEWNKNEMQLKLGVSALAAFAGRELSAAPTGTGPYTVTLKTDYDSNPTYGLVDGDLIRFYKASDGTTIDAVVASVVDGTSITTTTDVSTLAAGDMVYLRPATAVFNLLETFNWGKTEFHFGANLTAAAAAVQTRIERGSTWEVTHDFEDSDGAGRSGGFDPARLVRSTGDASFTVKRFFDTPEDIQKWNNLSSTSAVVKHLAGASNEYGLQVEFERLFTDGKVTPELKSGDILYSEKKMHVDYSNSAGRAYRILVTHGLSDL